MHRPNLPVKPHFLTLFDHQFAPGTAPNDGDGFGPKQPI